MLFSWTNRVHCPLFDFYKLQQRYPGHASILQLRVGTEITAAISALTIPGLFSLRSVMVSRCMSLQPGLYLESEYWFFCRSLNTGYRPSMISRMIWYLCTHNLRIICLLFFGGKSSGIHTLHLANLVLATTCNCDFLFHKIKRLLYILHGSVAFSWG